MSENTSKKAKVYGKKAGAKFSTPLMTSSSPHSPQIDHPEAKTLDVARKAGKVEQKALEDVTSAFKNIHLGASGGKVVDNKQESKPTAAKTPATPNLITREETKPPTTKVTTEPNLAEEWIEPLLDAYEKQTGERLAIQSWNDVFDSSWLLVKIAESSYAEVYKVSNDDGISVLKVMALRPPTGPGSQRESAVEVEDVISEVLIMDMMAEIPGFLEFKEAHIFRGRPPKAVFEAYAYHAANHETFFPNPKNYHKSQLWLALELGDAGTDLDNFRIETAAQIWDIFLGVVMALTQGETEYGFEHRDLHEGNVCVKQIREPKQMDPSQTRKFGHSGLQVTLLDYTLSRAQDEEVIYLDLENDLELFDPTAPLLQHAIYRRMRTYMWFRRRRDVRKLEHCEAPKLRTQYPWRDFMPYTNVLWIYYILDYIQQNFEGSPKELEQFHKDTEELRKKLNPDLEPVFGGFLSAKHVYTYIREKGWVTREDLDDWEESWIENSDSCGSSGS